MFLAFLGRVCFDQEHVDFVYRSGGGLAEVYFTSGLLC